MLNVRYSREEDTGCDSPAGYHCIAARFRNLGPRGIAFHPARLAYAAADFTLHDTAGLGVPLPSPTLSDPEALLEVLAPDEEYVVRRWISPEIEGGRYGLRISKSLADLLHASPSERGGIALEVELPAHKWPSFESTPAAGEFDFRVRQVKGAGSPRNQAFDLWRARFCLSRSKSDALRVETRLYAAWCRPLRPSASREQEWQDLIRKHWNSPAYLAFDPATKRAYPIEFHPRFVSDPKKDRPHYTVFVHNVDATIDMENWAPNDLAAPAHEYGHMLGARDEYGTIDGIPFGAPHNARGTIMNNTFTLGPPSRSHLDLLECALRSYLGVNVGILAPGETA